MGACGILNGRISSQPVNRPRKTARLEVSHPRAGACAPEAYRQLEKYRITGKSTPEAGGGANGTATRIEIVEIVAVPAIGHTISDILSGGGTVHAVPVVALWSHALSCISTGQSASSAMRPSAHR